MPSLKLRGNVIYRDKRIPARDQMWDYMYHLTSYIYLFMYVYEVFLKKKIISLINYLSWYYN